MATKNDHDTDRVTWSEEDREHVGLCAEFPGLTWLARIPEAARNGIRNVIEDGMKIMVPTPSSATGLRSPRQGTGSPRNGQNAGGMAAMQHLFRGRPGGINRGSKAFFCLLAAIWLVPFLSKNEAQGGPPVTMQLTSQAFAHNDSIPPLYTCDGKDISPPLSWSGLPPGTGSLVLIVDDPDAPDPQAPKMTWVHWVLYNIPAEVDSLTENAGRGELPAGTLAGTNSWGRIGYGGPCPPIGRHRYFFKLYALDAILADLGQPGKDELLRAMEGHILAQTEMIGTYQR